MRELLAHLERVAPGEGRSWTAVPFLSINRRSRVGPPHAHVLARTVGVLLAGQKRAKASRPDGYMVPCLKVSQNTTLPCGE